MTSRERVIRALNCRNPDRAPRDLWYLPGVELYRRDELEAVLERYPTDFHGPDARYGVGKLSRGTPNTVGNSTDEWGCVWYVAEKGVVGEVKEHPLADWDALDDLAAPWELLDQADFGAVNAQCTKTDRFVRAGTSVRPFERMQFLRGSENLFMDLACQPPELGVLRDRLHEFYLREIELWAQTNVDGVAFMDDWGSQGNLLIDPALWRTLFKPLYADYCAILKRAGKYVFFHSDGYIEPIIEDLIEIGVDALNSQLFCMDIEELAARFKGRITFWGEICRQHVLPFGSVDEVCAAVRRVRQALDDGSGGVIAQCEWGLRDPRENIEAVYETWLEPVNAFPTA